MASRGNLAGNQMRLMALPLALDKDPFDKDIDSEPQGTAGEGTVRGLRSFGQARRCRAIEVKIDWEGLTKRARQVMAANEMIGDLTAAPTSSVVAFTAVSVPSEENETFAVLGRYTVNLADGSAPSRVPSAPPSTPTEGGRRPGRGGGGFRGGGMVFSKDGRSLYFRSGRGIYVATVGGGGRPAESTPEAGGFAGRRGRRGA